MELGVAHIPVMLRELLELAEGKVLPLRRRISEPALLLVGDEPVFTALVAKRGDLRELRFSAPSRTELL